MSDIHIIPRPVRIEPGSGVLRLDADTTIGAPDPGHAAATLLAGMLRTSTGWAVPVQAGAGTIRFVLDASRAAALGDEGYELTSTQQQGVTIVAAADKGLLWSVQTLRQLLPAALEAGTPSTGVDWVVPAVHIDDRPRFS